MPNTLYYGDNLDILRNHIADESVDLVYLDPPFNSNRNYNVLFREKSGESSPSQIQAFTDTWQWDRNAEIAFNDLIDTGPHNVATMISAMREFVGRNDMMAYLVMMAQRLVELHRVLKPTGSLYLHCDPTASHYLKVLLDTVFGKSRYMSEISWKRSSAHNDSTQGRRNLGHIRDVIYFYTKTADYTWNPIFSAYDPEYVADNYRHKDADGRLFQKDNLTAAKGGGDTSYEWRVKRLIGTKEWQPDLTSDFLTPDANWEYLGVPPYKGRYWAYSHENLRGFAATNRLTHAESGMPRYKRFLDEMPGVPLQDDWGDIQPAFGKERLGYPTQKPLALLERIIAASSKPGDVVLDPFCGCGTAVVAAQKLGRRWVGIDITHLSIALMKNRLVDMFGPAVSFEIRGEPEDVGSATMLAEQDRYQFQWWAASLVNAQPVEGREKKGADRGIDGVIRFVDDAGQKLKRVIVQIKSGHVSSATMRDLIGTLSREDAEMALLVTLEPPTKPMRQEAVEAGDYHSPSWNRTYPRVQIATIEDLLAGDLPQIPPMRATFDRAQRIRAATHAQSSLLTGQS